MDAIVSNKPDHITIGIGRRVWWPALRVFITVEQAGNGQVRLTAEPTIGPHSKRLIDRQRNE